MLRLALLALVTSASPVELSRTLDVDDAAHYRLDNNTKQPLTLRDPTLHLSRADDAGGWHPLADQQCPLPFTRVEPHASRDLGQWDELCFGGGAGRYRASVVLIEADGGARSASTDFALSEKGHRAVLRPYTASMLSWDGYQATGPGAATACTCAGTRVGLKGQQRPLGDFPLNEQFMEKK